MIRCAVVFFAAKPGNGLRVLSQALADGLKDRGFEVLVADGLKSLDLKLSGFKYLLIGTDVRSWFKGTIDRRISEFLSSAGMIQGKKCFAFVSKGSPFSTQKTLANLMKALEFEGMILQLSDVFADAPSARTLAAKLKIE